MGITNWLRTPHDNSLWLANWRGRKRIGPSNWSVTESALYVGYKMCRNNTSWIWNIYPGTSCFSRCHSSRDSATMPLPRAGLELYRPVHLVSQKEVYADSLGVTCTCSLPSDARQVVAIHIQEMKMSWLVIAGGPWREWEGRQLLRDLSPAVRVLAERVEPL